MRVDFRTDVGLVRASNQDSVDCGLFSPQSAWAVVCDGMGGANGGNIASALALEIIRDQLLSGFREDMGAGNLKSMMLTAISRANEAVYDRSVEEPQLRGMGTTAVVMVACGGQLHVAHVGDSRAYLKTQHCVTQITMDHSYVQDLVNFGQITPEEAKVHPQRNIITRALGVHEDVRPDYSCFDFGPGDLALACSDGLSNYAEEDQLWEFMTAAADGKSLTDELVRHALESGGADNVTVAVIRND